MPLCVCTAREIRNECFDDNVQKKCELGEVLEHTCERRFAGQQMTHRTWTGGVFLLGFRKGEETINVIQGAEIQP